MISYLFPPREKRRWRGTGTLASPEMDFVDALGGGRAAAGVSVTEESALSLDAVWRAVNLIAGHVAKMPLWVYRHTGRRRERALDHPACYLLRYQPSGDMSAYYFRFALTASYLLNGNGYALIERRGGRPAALWPLVSQATRAEREGGRLVYKTTTAAGKEYTLAARDVLHIRGIGDGVRGLSVVAKARECLGSAIAMEEYTGRFFANSATPLVVLEHPAELGPEGIENIRRSWIERHRGLERAYAPAVLEEGMTLKQFGMSNRDAEFLAGKKHSVVQIANWFGLPPHKLGDTSRTSYNSLEQENQTFLDDSLDSHLVAWESECWDKLLTEREKREMTHYVEFIRAALLRSDLPARGAYYEKAITVGWLSRDEVRELENLNPIPDGEGEKFLRPMNMAEAGEEAEPPAPDDAPGQQAEEKLRRAAVLSEAFSRGLRRLARQAERAAGSGRLPAWLDGAEGELPALEEILRPGAALVGAPADVAARRLLDEVRAELAASPDRPEVERIASRLAYELPARLTAQITEMAEDGHRATLHE